MTQNNAKILLLATGGTIEKTYDETDGKLENRGTFVLNVLRNSLRLPATTLEAEAIMHKDSLYMTEEDRKVILARLQEVASLYDAIIVIHGTDTMEVTGRFCVRSGWQPGIPILFTGAMRPLGFIDSDGLQNLTEALAFAKVLSPGLYISFHNQVFPADQATKNADQRTFERAEISAKKP